MAVKWKWKAQAGGSVPAGLEQRVQTLENEVVKKTGNQDIAGNKTFTNKITVPTPTANTDAATKQYVDDKIQKRVLNITNTAGNTYTINPTNGYEIISVMAARKRSTDGYYFFTYHANLNFQLFFKDNVWKLYTEGAASGFSGDYMIIVLEKKI